MEKYFARQIKLWRLETQQSLKKTYRDSWLWWIGV